MTTIDVVLIRPIFDSLKDTQSRRSFPEKVRLQRSHPQTVYEFAIVLQISNACAILTI
jgi:hypothetical protein